MKAFRFRGFEESETFTAIPDTFLRELLAEIKDVAELKLVLYAIWRIQHLAGPVPALTEQDIVSASLGLTPDKIGAALERALEHQILLRGGEGHSARYFLNSPGGRAAADGMTQGKPGADGFGASAPLERPNVFRLYEENIGPLTPLIADALKDAERAYPAGWIEEAIELAAKNNKRSWSYCQAILSRWKEEGRGKKQNRRDSEAARQHDVEEKISKFIRG